MSGIVLIVRHVQVDRIKQVVVNAYSVNGPEISTFTWVERLPPPEPAGLTSCLVRQHYDVWSWKRTSIIKFEKKLYFLCFIYQNQLIIAGAKTPMCQWVFRLAKMIYSNKIKIRCLEVYLFIQTCLIIISIYNKVILYYLIYTIAINQSHSTKCKKEIEMKITVVHECHQKFWRVPKLIPHHRKNLASRIRAVVLEEDIGKSWNCFQFW